jgi:hypothetical protein
MIKANATFTALRGQNFIPTLPLGRVRMLETAHSETVTTMKPAVGESNSAAT